MTIRVDSFDGDAFAVLLQKEETTYRPKDYLWRPSTSSPIPPKSSRKRPLLDSVPLRVQQAAIEECVSFINSLSYGNRDSANAEAAIADTKSQASLPTFSRRISLGGCKSPSSVMSRTLFSSLRISDKRTTSSSQQSNHRPQSEGIINSLEMAEWRSKMVKWSQEIVTTLDLEWSCTELAFALFDRYLATRERTETASISRETFQLYCVTLLYTSVKLYSRTTLSVANMIKICGDIYDKKDFESAELHILEALEWKICPPLASSFVGCLIDLVPVRSSVQRKRILQKSLGFIDMAIADSSLVGERQSNIAVASVIAAAVQGDELVGSIEPDQLDHFMQNVEHVTTIEARSDEICHILDSFGMKTSPT